MKYQLLVLISSCAIALVHSQVTHEPGSFGDKPDVINTVPGNPPPISSTLQHTAKREVINDTSIQGHMRKRAVSAGTTLSTDTTKEAQTLFHHTETPLARALKQKSPTVPDLPIHAVAFEDYLNRQVREVNHTNHPPTSIVKDTTDVTGQSEVNRPLHAQPGVVDLELASERYRRNLNQTETEHQLSQPRHNRAFTIDPSGPPSNDDGQMVRGTHSTAPRNEVTEASTHATSAARHKRSVQEITHHNESSQTNSSHIRQRRDADDHTDPATDPTAFPLPTTKGQHPATTSFVPTVNSRLFTPPRAKRQVTSTVDPVHNHPLNETANVTSGTRMKRQQGPLPHQLENANISTDIRKPSDVGLDTSDHHHRGTPTDIGATGAPTPTRVRRDQTTAHSESEMAAPTARRRRQAESTTQHSGQLQGDSTPFTMPSDMVTGKDHADSSHAPPAPDVTDTQSTQSTPSSPSTIRQKRQSETNTPAPDQHSEASTAFSMPSDLITVEGNAVSGSTGPTGNSESATLPTVRQKRQMDSETPREHTDLNTNSDTDQNGNTQSPHDRRKRQAPSPAASEASNPSNLQGGVPQATEASASATPFTMPSDMVTSNDRAVSDHASSQAGMTDAQSTQSTIRHKRQADATTTREPFSMQPFTMPSDRMASHSDSARHSQVDSNGNTQPPHARRRRQVTTPATEQTPFSMPSDLITEVGREGNTEDRITPSLGQGQDQQQTGQTTTPSSSTMASGADSSSVTSEISTPTSLATDSVTAQRRRREATTAHPDSAPVTSGPPQQAGNVTLRQARELPTTTTVQPLLGHPGEHHQNQNQNTTNAH